MDAVGCQLDEMLRTAVDAGLAADTLGFLIEYLRLRTPSFRIMAPHTTQRTTFQEDRRPDAWPVINGISLNIKYQRTQLSIINCQLSIKTHRSPYGR